MAERDRIDIGGCSRNHDTDTMLDAPPGGASEVAEACMKVDYSGGLQGVGIRGRLSTRCGCALAGAGTDTAPANNASFAWTTFTNQRVIGFNYALAIQNPTISVLQDQVVGKESIRPACSSR